MTAEVCVLNKLGIALAADSAVTLGSRADKIYTSVDKLFNLSKKAPVGIMVYGGASYLGYPWETVVKEFRRQLGSETFDTLKEYADEFLRFLVNKTMFAPKVQDEHAEGLIHLFFDHARRRIEKRLDYEAETQDGLTDDDYPPLITDELGRILDEVKSEARIEGFGAATLRAVREKYKQTISDARDEIFGKLSLEQTALRHLYTIGVELLARAYFGPLESGVVIAGFGDSDYLPCLYSFRIEGVAAGKLRFVRQHVTEVSHNRSASVIPFAQQEMVHTFMRGVDPNYFEFMRKTTRESLTGAITQIGDIIGQDIPHYDDKIAPAIRKASEELLESMFSSWEAKQQDSWLPVVDIVDSLPKDELAAMAEALVNLTKFRRRVTTDRETVGGPIDVAIITKGDGFVWVKRKHYFRPELNPRVMAKYVAEADHD